MKQGKSALTELEKIEKRIGRPMKEPPPKKTKGRVKVGLSLTVTTKRLIDQKARISGRTQSQEVELLIEKALALEAVLEAMNVTAADLKKQTEEAAFSRAGFTKRRGAHGKEVWFKETDPKLRSGFIEEE